MLPKFSARARGVLIRGCSFVSLVLVTIACGHSRACALAATEPADGAAIETTINPALANRTPDAPTPDRPVAPAQTGNPLWAIPLRSLSMTRERPLFSPARRPPAPAVVAAPSVPRLPPPLKPAEPDRPLLTLMGTIVGKTQSIGIFVDQATKNVIRLRIGQGHTGWTLRAIQLREVIFEKDKREATLALPARSATVAAAIPVAAQLTNSWKDGDGQLISPPSTLTPPGQHSAAWATAGSGRR